MSESSDTIETKSKINLRYFVNIRILIVTLFLLSITAIYKTFAPEKFDLLLEWLLPYLPTYLIEVSPTILSISLEILILIFLISFLTFLVLSCFASDGYPITMKYFKLFKVMCLNSLLLYFIILIVNYLFNNVEIVNYFINEANIWEQCTIIVMACISLIATFSGLIIPYIHKLINKE